LGEKSFIKFYYSVYKMWLSRIRVMRNAYKHEEKRLLRRFDIGWRIILKWIKNLL
jgi:hypothetical protein